MNKFSKGLLSIVLAMCLSTSPMTALADSSFDPLKYQSSQAQEESIDMVLEGNTLQFTHLPDNPSFNFVWVKVNDQNGTCLIDEIHGRDYLIGQHQSISLSSLANGNYFVEIFTAPEHYTTYYSKIYGKVLALDIIEQKAAFQMPLVYTSNVSIYESKRTDEYALSYYLEPSDDIQSDHKNIRQLSESITKGLESDYDKAKAIHDWICNNIWYNWDAFLSGSDYGDTSALGTLTAKKSVCQGYASLNAALLRAAGIPTKLVSGYALGVGEASQWLPDKVAQNKSNHAWNEAYIDGCWVIIDCTWDSSNDYKNGKYSTETGLDGYKYFDPTIAVFAQDHMLIDYDEEVPHWWMDDDKLYYYADDKGNLLKGLQKIEGSYYYFDEKGVMKVGWQTIKGKKYYFEEDGIMAKSVSLVIKGKKYSFDKNGNSKLIKQ